MDKYLPNEKLFTLNAKAKIGSWFLTCLNLLVLLGNLKFFFTILSYTGSRYSDISTSFSLFAVFFLIYTILFFVITIKKSIDFWHAQTIKDIIVTYIKWNGQILFIIGFILGFGLILGNAFDTGEDKMFLYYLELKKDNSFNFKPLIFLSPLTGLITLGISYFLVEIINIFYNINDCITSIKNKLLQQ